MMKTNETRTRTMGALTAGALLAAGCAGGSVAKKGSDGPPERPNVLFILAEDMTTDLGCYGREDVRTPNIDRLSAEGVMYTNARCVAPLSSPTRSSMMTGLHHTITGSHNHRSNADRPLPDTTWKPVTWYLRKAGYTCVLGDRDCFENPVTHADHESTRKIDCNFRYDPVGNYDGVNCFGLFDKLYDIDKDDVPFFSQVTLYVTHRGDWWKDIRSKSDHPVDPATVTLPPYLADHPKIREEFACYLDQVEYMDSEVGLLIEKLEKKKLLDNTVIIFIADNGRAEIRDKGWMYEEGTHVPMIVWWKGIKHEVVDDLVSELDITASLLKLAGVPQPDYYQGKPLDIFLPERERTGGHEFVYIARDNWDENMECLRSITDSSFIYVRNYRPDLPYDSHHLYQDFYRPAVHVMRRLNEEGRLHGPEKLFFATSKPQEELYDWREDPYCIHNLAADPAYADTLAKRREEMDGWLAGCPDRGIEDRYTRVLPENRREENRQRYWTIVHHPDLWKSLEEGEICDFYDRMKIEMKAAKGR